MEWKRIREVHIIWNFKRTNRWVLRYLRVYKKDKDKLLVKGRVNNPPVKVAPKSSLAPSVRGIWHSIPSVLAASKIQGLPSSKIFTMKILLDLKSLQGKNSYSEIGKITFEISWRLISNLKDYHKPTILLSNLNTEKGIYVKRELKLKCLHQELNFEIVELEGFSNYLEIYNKTKTINKFILYELLLEWKVSQINPDIFFTFSFFELDNPTSIGKLKHWWYNFVMAYDDVLYKEHFLSNKKLKAWYSYKLGEFKKADMFFSVSETIKNSLIERLNIPEEKIRVIPLGCNEIFKPLSRNSLTKARKELEKLGIRKSFILCVVYGNNQSNNLENLIKAYSMLEKELRQKYILVIAYKAEKENLPKFQHYAKSLGIKNDVVFIDKITDEILVKLYNLCTLFVYPVYYQGFGVPVIEAMRCEAPVIASNVYSVKQLIEKKEATFNPQEVEEISRKISLALKDGKYRKFLKNNSIRQARGFSWNRAVEIILEMLQPR